MVEFIKEIVSGKKRRYRDGGYNLDLTYVTDRIIGMSFPSAGFESMYRNNIEDVSKLLGNRHNANYMVVNLSGRKYNYEKFHGKVVDYAWEDHHSPPLELLFEVCRSIHEFLHKDLNNVVVVHCVAGKGRTGTVISCYLLYSGRFDDTEEALQYYKLKRFQKGGGVTQPSQLRYVRYFWVILNGYLQKQLMMSPSVVQIDKIIIYGIPKISTGYFRPYVEIYSVRDKVLRYSTKGTKKSPMKYIIKENEENSPAEIQFFEKKPLIMAGDILVKVYHMGTLSSSLVFRFGFNTSFLQKDADNRSVLTVKIHEVDPDKTQNDDRFPRDFRAEVYMRNLEVPVDKTSATDALISGMYHQEEPHWQNVYDILKNYKRPQRPEASELLFKDPSKDDVEAVLKGQKLVKEEVHPNEPSSDPESDKSDPHEDVKSDGSHKYIKEDHQLSEAEESESPN